MAPTAQWKSFWRIRSEASFDAASPEGGADWNIGGNGGGGDGWIDMPAIDSDGLQPKRPVIFPTGMTGQRAMNGADPVQGANLPELGSIEFPVYPELIDRILASAFGQSSKTPTAGAAAKASTAFGSLADLDTQPDGTEVLKFVISDSSDATGASIDIIQDGLTVETITIGTNGSSVDGDYYSQGAYDGSTNAITFSTSGTVTGGNVVVSGIDYVTTEFTQYDTNPTLVIEQGGRPEAGSGNSEFFPGVIVPALQFSYDRNTPDGLLMANATFHGQMPTGATAGTYANAVALYYKPIAAWNGTLTLDGAGSSQIVSAQININSNSELYNASSGNQKAQGQIEGQLEVSGTINLRPDDETLFDAYKGATVRDFKLDFVTPHYVVDTTGWRVLFDMSTIYISDYTRTRIGQALGATLTFRGVYNTTESGAAKVTTRSRMPV